MPMPTTRALLAALSILVLPACSRAQATHDHAAVGGSREDAAAGADAARDVHESMIHGPSSSDPHLVLTPARVATSTDSARARAILGDLERGIARYADYKAALADGYEPFLPNLKQPVYHFTSTRQAIRSAFGFDASAPTSLLYEKSGRGYRLVGAMYTAPKRATAEELDARVPLSIAQWHAHVNICVPSPRDRGRWRETESGRMRFGPKGAIATKEDCDAAGGRWFPQLFGWMVHVNPFEKDPAKVWGTHGSGSHGNSGGEHHGH